MSKGRGWNEKGERRWGSGLMMFTSRRRRRRRRKEAHDIKPNFLQLSVILEYSGDGEGNMMPGVMHKKHLFRKRGKL